MRKILLVFIILFVHSFSFSQDLNKIGAAGISFLLNSQSGQQNLNQDEKVALSILGSFLNEQSNRQHDLNVANATSTKVIQSTNGSSIQLMKDLEGNVYLVQDGIVHKISSSVVSLAANTVETIESKRYLPNYNLSELKTKCEHLPSDNSKYEDRKVETKHINYSISTKTILEQYPSATSIRKTGTKEYYYDSRGIRISQIPTNTQINIAYLPNYDKKLTELKTTFTCKWYDWNTSLATQMDDFEEITRTFFTTDNAIYLIVNFFNYSLKPITLEISIYDNSGKILKENSFNSDKQGNLFYSFEIFIGELEVGSYMYKVNMVGEITNNILLRERFQILE